MSWDWGHAALASAAVAALGGAGMAFSAWRGAHNAWIQAKETIRGQEQTIRDAKRSAAQIASEERQRDQAAAEQLAAMKKQVERLKTARQIADWLPKQLATPEPVKIEVPRKTKSHPAPAAIATIPQPDLPALRDYVESCKECSVRLQAEQEDLAGQQEQLRLAGERLSAVEKERDAALKAAKGGGFWHRLKNEFKWFAIGAGAGAAALCGSGHCK